MEDDVGCARLDAQAPLSHHAFRSVNRDRDAGRGGFHCEVKGPLLEGQKTPIAGSRPFNKCGDVQTLLKHATGYANALDGAVCAAVAIYGNEIAELHRIAQHGNAHDGAFDKGRSAAGNARDEGRRVEIGDVIGHEDAGGVRRHVFRTARFNANAREAEPNADDCLRCVVEGSCIAGDYRPGNEDERRGRTEHEDGAKQDERSNHASGLLGARFEALGQFFIDAVEAAIGEYGDHISGLKLRQQRLDDGVDAGVQFSGCAGEIESPDYILRM